MLAQDSPFRPYWWGISLESAGVDSRPDVGTYGRYEFRDLPPVPYAMSGDLAWLAAQPAHDEWSIGTEPAAALPALLSACERLGVSMPSAFTAFMRTPTLQRRIRSGTACFVDVGAEPVRSPIGDGYLVRFLADQQGCLFWYLYLAADGRDHAVVCSANFYGEEEPSEGDDDDDGEPDEIVFCGESFETFLCRYWLENEIWFADNDNTPMPDVGAEYIRRYRDLGATARTRTDSASQTSESADPITATPVPVTIELLSADETRLRALEERLEAGGLLARRQGAVQEVLVHSLDDCARVGTALVDIGSGPDSPCRVRVDGPGAEFTYALTTNRAEDMRMLAGWLAGAAFLL